MDNPYAAAPIDVRRGEVRLIKLEPGDPSKPIKCTLRTYSLGDDSPNYIALSYSWGSKERYNEIELNGCKFPVGRSLWSLLYRTQQQQHHKDALIWIDALCINQIDIRERNHQVQLMRQIYSNAKMVWVWLGEADNDSDTAMRYIKRREPFDHSNANFSKLLNVQKSVAVLRLCERTYWTRIWIVQEVMLAREITVLCGDHEVCWSRLQQLINDLQMVQDRGRAMHTPGVSAILESQAAVIIRAKSNWDGAQDLVALLELYRYQQASDIRDKVYGVHGLVHGSQAMAIDYHIGPEALLTKVIGHICSLKISETYTKRSQKEIYCFGKMMNEVLQTCISEKDLLCLVNVAINAYYDQENRLQTQQSAGNDQGATLPFDNNPMEVFTYDNPGVLVCSQSTEPDHFQRLRTLEHPTWSLPTQAHRRKAMASTAASLRSIPFDPLPLSPTFLEDHYMSQPLLDDDYTRPFPIHPQHSQQFSEHESPQAPGKLPQSLVATNPTFECLFWYLDCSYTSRWEAEWRCHCREHLRGTDPPKYFVCETCNTGKMTRFEDGWECWEHKMQHYVKVHAANGSRLIPGDLAFARLSFMQRQRELTRREGLRQEFGGQGLLAVNELESPTHETHQKDKPAKIE
jgi:hypothetical protein